MKVEAEYTLTLSGQEMTALKYLLDQVTVKMLKDMSVPPTERQLLMDMLSDIKGES